MMKKLVILLALMLCCLSIPALAAGPELTLSLASGFYEYPMPLEIQCTNQKATIYYTLDGSIPDENSLVYEEALTLLWSNDREDTLTKITGITAGETFVPSQDFPTAHVVRAVAITPRGERSEVVSGTYFIGYDRKALYGDIALVFLVTDPDGLFNYETGIYVLGRVYDEWAAQQTGTYESWQATANFTQRGDAWERPVSVTFLPALNAGGEGFTQDMGMRIKGGASRGNNQKSLRLIARDDYGAKSVKYAIYPDNLRESDGEVVDKYKSFTLRNGGNDADFGRIRDPFINNMAAGLRLDTAQNMPVVAFLNGEYWGLYTLNEEFTDNYIQYHYGIDNQNVVMIKCGELDEGEEADYRLFTDMFDFIADSNMAVPANYEKACELLDMGSFADYCALHFYIANEDGPYQNNNWQMWRVRRKDVRTSPYADGKWRMMLYDTDFSSGIYESGGNGAVQNIVPVLSASYEGRHPARLLVSLMQNEDFMQQFILSCCDIRNLYFSAKRVQADLSAMIGDYLPYRPDTLHRFGPQWALWNARNHAQSNMDSISTFFKARYTRFTDVVRAAFELDNAYTVTVKVSDKALGSVYLNGRMDVPAQGAAHKYFTGYPITATAVPVEGARFVGWKLSSQYATLSDPASPTTQITFTRAFTLTAIFE